MPECVCVCVCVRVGICFVVKYSWISYAYMINISDSQSFMIKTKETVVAF